MSLTRSKVRGCLFGALAGDCLGFPFENEQQTFLRKNFGDDKNADYQTQVVNHVKRVGNGPVEKEILYTDDTCMSKDIAESLFECKEFNAENMSKRFTETFDANRHMPRSYGSNIGVVFHKMKSANYKNSFQFGQEQFNGTGSCGNGGAMRVAPAVLYFANDFDKALECVKQQCRLTHAHPDGIMGAIMEASAIYFALQCEKDAMNSKEFIEKLKAVVLDQNKLVCPKIRDGSKNVYYEKLDKFQRLLDENASVHSIVGELGTGVLAAMSVPAAVFAFVKCLAPVSGIKIENPLERTIAYAISLGGDTDTIATMAGAIAGAYYGDEHVPDTWTKTFEGAKDYERYVDLFWNHLSK